MSLRSDDLVVPQLPACGREWWRRLVPPSTGGDWWATCHDESCTRHSRLQCNIRVSPLLPPPLYLQRRCPPWTAAEGSVPRDWTGEKKKENLRSSVSVPLVKGDRVGPGLGGHWLVSRCTGVFVFWFFLFFWFVVLPQRNRKIYNWYDGGQLDIMFFFFSSLPNSIISVEAVYLKRSQSWWRMTVASWSRLGHVGAGALCPLP